MQSNYQKTQYVAEVSCSKVLAIAVGAGIIDSAYEHLGLMYLPDQAATQKYIEAVRAVLIACGAKDILDTSSGADCAYGASGGFGASDLPDIEITKGTKEG